MKHVPVRRELAELLGYFFSLPPVDILVSGFQLNFY